MVMALFRLSNTLYELRGRTLHKVAVGTTKQEDGKTYRFNQNKRWELVESVAPGQMDLFGGGGLPVVQDQSPMPQAQSSAPAGGHAEMVHSAMGSHKGKIDAMVAAHKGRIDGMNLNQLYNHAPDVEYDDYHVDAVNALDAEIKSRVAPEHHQQIDKHFDDAYENHKDLGYSGHVKELEKHHSKRIDKLEKHIEAVKDKHYDDFQAFVDAIDEPNTLEEWNTAKKSINQRYKETLRAATAEVSGLDGGANNWSDLIENLEEIKNSALETYSDDPENWGQDDDESDNASVGDTLHDNFIDLVNDAMEDTPLGELKSVIDQHYAALLEKGKKRVPENEFEGFKENLDDAYQSFLDDLGDYD
jgi:hypothetical protein